MKAVKFSPHREITSCPLCGHGFTVVDQMVCSRDVNYQCRNCWNRVWPAARSASLPEESGLYAAQRKKHAGAA